MQVKKTKTGAYSYSYKGDIDKCIRECENELRLIERDLPMFDKIYEKAKKEYEAKIMRKNHLKNFIKLANDEKRKNDGHSDSKEAN